MPGVILALETSGPIGSAALAVDGAVAARRFLGERGRHAASLPEAMAAVIAEAGLCPSAVDAVAVGAGPGSFTGVRVAAAAANGFAHALGIGVCPVSSLEAAAVGSEALPPGVGPWPRDAPRPPFGLRRVLFDARGDRLFTAVYRVGPTTCEEIVAPRFARLAEVCGEAAISSDRDELAAFVLCGDGAVRHRVELERAGAQVALPPAGVPTADGVLWAWIASGRPAGVPPGRWDPAYLRDTGAVRARRDRP